MIQPIPSRTTRPNPLGRWTHPNRRRPSAGSTAHGPAYSGASASAIGICGFRRAQLDANASPRWQPGLFTLETGETSFRNTVFPSACGLNKFSRMPGNITSLQLIPSAGFGVTHWLSVFFDIDAQDHVHVGNPSQLSLSSVNAANPQYLNTIYNSVLPSTGFPPAYVEDVPFASHSGTGVGEVDLGFKIGLLSERRGKPLSLSIRNDFYLPTKTGLSDLLANQVQYGKFNYGIGVEASKTILHHSMTATANWAYRFTQEFELHSDDRRHAGDGRIEARRPDAGGRGLFDFSR